MDKAIAAAWPENCARRVGKAEGAILLPASGEIITGHLSPFWLATIVLVLSGLASSRPVKATPPFLMTSLCLLGMFLGLSIDQHFSPPFGWGQLFASADAGLVPFAVAHITAFPAMHGCMLLGGASAILFGTNAREPSYFRCRARGARAGLTIARNMGMLAGMVAGAWACQKAFPLAWSLSGMIAAMTSGMVLGMVAVMVAFGAASAFRVKTGSPAK